MHPELLNNSLFLRYYRQWQDDPSSIVFAPIAEFFLKYGMLDDAFKICREGLKRHPGLVSGRTVMAKVHLKRGNWEEAEEELRTALSVAPTNASACALMADISAIRERERASGVEIHRARAFVPLKPEGVQEHRPEAGPSLKTVTMAGIYVSQGHLEQARVIYKAILASDPTNEAARKGLAALPSLTP